jgi:hypothetical protein
MKTTFNTKIILILLSLCTPLLADDTVKKAEVKRYEQFYCIHSGDNYQHELWKMTSPTEFKKMDKSTIYEHFRIEHGDKKTKIYRTVGSPSGDWFFQLIYHYNEKGSLITITSIFNTYNGLDAKHPEADTEFTRHFQKFLISPKKKLTQTDSLIQDVKTEKKVDRTFFQPEIQHWMTLNEIPKLK